MTHSANQEIVLSAATSSIVRKTESGLARKGSVKNLPVNLFGAVMGLSGLALAWPYIPHIVRANNSQLARRGAALAGYVWGGCVASMMRSEFSSHSRKSFRRDR